MLDPLRASTSPGSSVHAFQGQSLSPRSGSFRNSRGRAVSVAHAWSGHPVASTLPGGSVHAVQRAVTVTALSCSGLFRHSLEVSPSTVQGSLRVPAVGGGGHNRGAVKLVKPIFTHSFTQTGSPRALARRSPQGRFLARTETPCQRSHNGFASSGRPPSYALGSTHVGLPTCRFLGNDSVNKIFFFFLIFSSEREQEDARSQARTPEAAAPGTWGR